MKSESKPVEEQVQQVAENLLDRRRLFKSLAILAGVGTLASVASSQKRRAVSPELICPVSYDCYGSYSCSGYFSCENNFTCHNSYSS